MQRVLTLLRKRLTLDDILSHGTPNIDVLAILKAGEFHARNILSSVGDRGNLFGIDPHEIDHYGEPLYGRRIENIVFPLPPKGFVYTDNPETYQPPELDYSYLGFSEEEAQKLKAEEPKPLRFPERRLPNPENSVIICDDVIEGRKHTFDRVKVFMTRQLDYNFRSDNPLHFGTVQDVMDFDTITYTGGIDKSEIFLVRS